MAQYYCISNNGNVNHLVYYKLKHVLVRQKAEDIATFQVKNSSGLSSCQTNWNCCYQNIQISDKVKTGIKASGLTVVNWWHWLVCVLVCAGDPDVGILWLLHFLWPPVTAAVASLKRLNSHLTKWDNNNFAAGMWHYFKRCCVIWCFDKREFSR